MTLKSEFDLERFFAAVRKCEGDVSFESTEGDLLNLKSTLCVFVFTAARAEGELLQGKILCEKETDYQKLKDFLND